MIAKYRIKGKKVPDILWQKGTFLDEVTSIGEEIKPVALAIVELHRSEGIS